MNATPDMRRTLDVLGLHGPTTVAGAGAAPLLPNAQQRPCLRLPLPGAGPNMGGVRAMTPGSVQAPAPNVSLPLGSGGDSASSASTGVGQAAAHVSNVIFGLTNDIGGPGGLVGGPLPGGLQAGQVTASPVQGTKEWHQSVTPDLRNHLVHKLVQAIFPTPDPQVSCNYRFRENVEKCCKWHIVNSCNNQFSSK